MGANAPPPPRPPGMASLGPRGLIGRIYLGATKDCHIINMLTVGFMVSEKKIFKVFGIISLRELYMGMAAIFMYFCIKSSIGTQGEVGQL